MSENHVAPHILPAGFPLLERRAIFAALDNPVRIAILAVLHNGEGYGVGDLAGLVKSSAPNVSKHLQAMKNAGLLYIGRGHLYYIQPAFNPSPNSGILDFGHCLLRLEVRHPPA
jgi:predicted transcriptional regulator